MKKSIFAVFLALTLICTVIFANPATNKAHKGLVIGEKTKVNCAYCHKKVGIVKEKGKADVEALKKGEFCATKECHPSVDKKK
jgi:hypothetical protein